MSLDGVIASGRRAAEALMVDTCEVRRPTGERTPDEFGRLVDEYETVYVGACKIQVQAEREARAEAGARTTVLQRGELQVPVTAGPLLAGDLADLTSSTFAPFLVGATYRVAAPAEKSMATAQRVPVDREVRA